jgi:FkbM family methyltransferase
VTLRRLARAPGLRRLAQRPLGHRLASAYTRGSLVQQRARFIARELAGSPKLATYRLRGSEVGICLRHSTPDVYTLDQVFLQRLFGLPEPVLEALRPHADELHAVDLGANIGLFGASLLAKFPNATLLAFEPDPSNAKVLACCIAANDREGNWRVVEACAATANGTVAFIAGEYGISHIAVPGEPGASEVAAVDVFPELGDAQLVKFDIEGAEWELLADPRFSAVPAAAIHLEYHTRLSPQPDARGCAIEALERAGYSWLPVVHSSDGNGIIWGWRS